ncbi:hypothetical protein GGR56DRAFT_632438 [Xylariaceae sp. FL0804]|nr:hypothetical protein GGR56DRAFT_632438 [Xylariaceae sp. FL0804]
MAPLAEQPHHLARALLLLHHPRRAARATGTDVTTVPQGYGDGPFGPPPGVVVGIVLGSVAGFLLLLWFVYWCVNLGGGGGGGGQDTSSLDGDGRVGVASVVSRHSRPRTTTTTTHRRSSRSRSRSRHRRHNSHHRRSGGHRETVEVRRSERVVVPDRVPPGPDQIVVEERRSSFGVGHRAPPRVVPVDDYDEDEVVVIEEHTPPRPHRRDSRGPPRGVSRERRRSSAGSRYRDVDPYRDASRRRSDSRR